MRPLFAVVLLLLAVRAAGQAPPLVESIDVRVVSVDVVVTDRAGNAVPNLTKDDFEILEENRPQTITNFAELRGDPATAVTTPNAPPAAGVAPPRTRSFLIFVDNGSIQPQMRKPLVDSLERFVDQLRPSDVVSVVGWGRGIHIVAPLTSDKGTLRMAIERLVTMALPATVHNDLSRVQRQCTKSLNMALTGRMQMTAAYIECIAEARRETSAAANDARQVLQGIDIALAMIADAPGKRSLIVAGAQMPRNPGAAIYAWANQLFTPYLSGFNAPRERPEVREMEQQELAGQVARRASERGVTLYMLASTSPAGMNDSSSPDYTPDMGVAFLHQRDTEDSFSEMASQTGGFMAGRSQLQRALQAIDRETSSYYSLGYHPAGEWRGPRAIAVRMKNKEYAARTRRTVSPRDAGETMRDRVIANVFRTPEETKWKIAVRAGKPQRAGRGTFTVPIEVRMAPTITLLSQGNDVAGGFEVFISVGNESGALSDMFRHVQGVRMPKVDEAAFRATPIVFTASLTVRGGENLLSVGVMDQVTNTAGFARAEIVAKEP
ncbi:MAG TPA: VWA domain-containing protein [Thermoanaerobaculia bacterium]|jgi:VWFA-related protein|nr:VWA domain-containing protein [Thermoanaerobaculia bacterium]